ncbi:acyl-CoA dehydrogenase [Sphingomonas sp. Leaf24]|uniref:acyl-CoA dehydrogenase family protein n=1 Tax=unclassified Sphingomonas TaxID=196159 RepID=UPI0006F1C4D6|nr:MULTISPECIES: acyl-CoA dehydrogenase family protein [unclassified Sphingomonas]KQM18071.1 acyl-CoA dehydrogenase [Sphingomonas sp. Leaf5]KQM89052.1 acyl-CoA dehydrogenase [Sphingomonas sp. Leaf24]
MPLFLNDDQTMLADTAREFLCEAAPVAQLRALRDADDPTGFDRGLWAKFAEMGFTGMMAPESAGGLGLGHVEAGIVLEEIGRNLSPSPFLTTSVAAVAALSGTTAGERWLPRIAAGETVAALAIDERAKHGDAVAMRAERSGNGFRLVGTKQFVVHGHVADLILVIARTAGGDRDADGLTLFALPADTPGLSADPRRLTDSSIAARLTFDHVEVDGDAVVGAVDDGRGALDRLLAAARTGAAAESLGVGDGAATRTLDYLRQRKQFGQTIGSFQALQHRAAHLYSELEIARAAVLKAQQLLDEGAADADTAVSVAKAMAGMASTLAVQEAVQMHGGIGMTDDADIGFFMKRARVLSEMFGDIGYHSDRIARIGGY